MRIAVLADIHGNLPALEAVLNTARKARVDQLLVLGDLVGYYYWPAECFDLLQEWSWRSVRGNHEDLYAVAARDADERARIHARYGSGIEVALSAMAGRAATLLGWPRAMQVTAGRHSALLCHGTPWETDEYVYPDAPAEKREQMAAAGGDFVFFGHTHYPVVWHVGGKVVANPGSVGQPRNRIPGAHWLLWDAESGQVEARREEYAVDRVVAECQRRDPENPYLASVLTRQ